MGITSILTINGTAYTASQRAGAHILPTGLERTLEGGYDSLTFWEIPTSPFPTYVNGQLVSLTIDIGDGAGDVTRFSGVITDCQSEHGQLGWGHAYTCESLKFLSDRIPITAVDNTGQQVYNRSPLDEYYTPSDAGLELGEIIRRILCIPGTAQSLDAVGIGGYTGLPSAPVLPAASLADLALLTVVPPRPVIFSGEAVFNAIDQEVSQWMPKWFSEIEPDGTIRFKDSTSPTYFVPQTITCPSADGAGDPVTPPRVQRSTRNCATRLVLRGGPQVEVAILSLVDGTLAEVFTPTDKTNWNLTYFTAPKGATDYGTITAVTSTSATLQSNSALTTWATNFWSNNSAIVSLNDSTGSLISQFETRLVTSNNAMSAGGTSTVNWDATWPITGTAYDSYRITGGSGGLNDTWRTYAPREPLTGNTGLDTYVGAHLVTRSAHAVRVANADQSFHAYYTTAIVKGGNLGQEMSLGVQAVPSEGMFRFTQPTVTVFGQTSTLNTTGKPTTTAEGKPIDVIVYALYSRGALSVVVPPDVTGVPQYEGTAFTEDGVEVTKYLDIPQWLWVNDTTSFSELAQQFLDTLSNAEVDLSIGWYLTPDGPIPAWDFLAFGYSLNVGIAGQSSPWSDINAPIRGIGIKWDWTGQGSQSLTFHASTRRRAFAGFDLYIHPEFAQGSPLSNAFTESNSYGNYEAYDQVRRSGGLPKNELSTGNQTSLAPSGFTMDDVRNAGWDNGAGINPPEKGSMPKPPSVRSEAEQEQFAANHESPLERRSRETSERRNAKEQAADNRQDAREQEVEAKKARRDAQKDRKAEEAFFRAGKVDGLPNTALKRPQAGGDDVSRQEIGRRAEMKKHDRQKENRGNLERLEIGKRNANRPAATPDDQIKNLGNHAEQTTPAEIADIRARGRKAPPTAAEIADIQRRGKKQPHENTTIDAAMNMGDE